MKTLKLENSDYQLLCFALLIFQQESHKTVQQLKKNNGLSAADKSLIAQSSNLVDQCQQLIEKINNQWVEKHER